MHATPLIISLLFIATTLAGVFIFARSMSHPRPFFLLAFGWMLVQSALAISGFFENNMGTPPRFLFLAGPPMLTILTLLFTNRGRNWIKTLNPAPLTLFHTIRIPVELVLYGLYLSHNIPELMTFEGKNPDILTGITAPIIYFLAFKRKILFNKLLLLWNLAGLAFLVNIVSHAVLSVPSPFQQLAFEQPNIAILYFPFNWLPALVVPLAFLSHLAVLLQLSGKGKSISNQKI